MAIGPTSLYLDTPGLDVYHGRGSFGRAKYRLRRYDSGPSLFVERKCKVKYASVSGGRGSSRQSWPCSTPRTGPRTGRGVGSAGVSARGSADLPHLYERVARVGTSLNGPIRLTVDRDFLCRRASAFDLPHLRRPCLLRRPGVVELKYRAAMPALFRPWSETRPSPAPASKYRAGVMGCVIGPGPGAGPMPDWLGPRRRSARHASRAAGLPIGPPWPGVVVAGLYRWARRGEAVQATFDHAGAAGHRRHGDPGHRRQRGARAFSLVGALSVVRFRTVVKDTQDTAFVIFAVVGMAWAPTTWRSHWGLGRGVASLALWPRRRPGEWQGSRAPSPSASPRVGSRPGRWGLAASTARRACYRPRRHVRWPSTSSIESASAPDAPRRSWRS
ncbi:MAG: VTC domain-containing protein [Singulisphaera sp.]